MKPYVNVKRNAVLMNFLFLSFAFFVEIVGFSGLFSTIPEAYREQVGNICVIIVICITAYLKLHPSKSGALMADLMTIVLACVVSLPMMKSDGSFFNILNIIFAFGVVFVMAFCSSKEMLNEKYKNFLEYINSNSDDVASEPNSYSKYLRSSTEIPKQYVKIIDNKIPEIENYENFFLIPINSTKDYKKLSENYYNLYRFYKEKGFGFWLIKDKESGHAIKIEWYLND